MQDYSLQSRQPIITWVLIADERHAQIYDCLKAIRKVPTTGTTRQATLDANSGLELVPALSGNLKAKPIDAPQIGHNRPRKSSSRISAVPTINIYETEGVIDVDLSQRFTKSIADKLNQASDDKFFDRLVVLAPEEMIGQVKKQMLFDVQRRIVATLPKDLMSFQGRALMEHLHDTLAPTHQV